MKNDCSVLREDEKQQCKRNVPYRSVRLAALPVLTACNFALQLTHIFHHFLSISRSLIELRKVTVSCKCTSLCFISFTSFFVFRFFFSSSVFLQPVFLLSSYPLIFVSRFLPLPTRKNAVLV